MLKKLLTTTTLGFINTSILGAVLLSSPAAKADMVEGYSPTFEVSTRHSKKRHIAELDYMQPVWGNEEFLSLVDLKLKADNDKSKEINLGLAARYNFGDNVIMGVYGYFDHRRTGNDFGISGATIGAEALSKYLDVRVNYYVPQDKRKKTADGGKKKVEIQGTRIYAVSGGHQYEYALKGYDFEVGTSLFAFNDELNDKFGTKLFVAKYDFRHKKAKPISGIRFRLEQKLGHLSFGGNGLDFTLNAETQYDKVRKRQNYIGLGAKLTFGNEARKKPSQLKSRMMDTIIRDVDIVTETAKSARQISEFWTKEGRRVKNVYYVGGAGGGYKGTGTKDSPLSLEQLGSVDLSEAIVVVTAIDAAKGGQDLTREDCNKLQAMPEVVSGKEVKLVARGSEAVDTIEVAIKHNSQSGGMVVEVVDSKDTAVVLNPTLAGNAVAAVVEQAIASGGAAEVVERAEAAVAVPVIEQVAAVVEQEREVLAQIEQAAQRRTAEEQARARAQEEEQRRVQEEQAQAQARIQEQERNRAQANTSLGQANQYITTALQNGNADNLAQAERLLAEVARLDPNNTDLNGVRGRLTEARGTLQQRAQAALVRAQEQEAQRRAEEEAARVAAQRAQAVAQQAQAPVVQQAQPVGGGVQTAEDRTRLFEEHLRNNRLTEAEALLMRIITLRDRTDAQIVQLNTQLVDKRLANIITEINNGGTTAAGLRAAQGDSYFVRDADWLAAKNAFEEALVTHNGNVDQAENTAEATILQRLMAAGTNDVETRDRNSKYLRALAGAARGDMDDAPAMRNNGQAGIGASHKSVVDRSGVASLYELKNTYGVLNGDKALDFVKRMAIQIIREEVKAALGKTDQEIVALAIDAAGVAPGQEYLTAVDNYRGGVGRPAAKQTINNEVKNSSSAVNKYLAAYRALKRIEDDGKVYTDEISGRFDVRDALAYATAALSDPEEVKHNLFTLGQERNAENIYGFQKDNIKHLLGGILGESQRTYRIGKDRNNTNVNDDIDSGFIYDGTNGRVRGTEPPVDISSCNHGVFSRLAQAPNFRHRKVRIENKTFAALSADILNEVQQRARRLTQAERVELEALMVEIDYDPGAWDRPASGGVVIGQKVNGQTELFNNNGELYISAKDDTGANIVLPAFYKGLYTDAIRALGRKDRFDFLDDDKSKRLYTQDKIQELFRATNIFEL